MKTLMNDEWWVLREQVSASNYLEIASRIKAARHDTQTFQGRIQVAHLPGLSELTVGRRKGGLGGETGTVAYMLMESP